MRLHVALLGALLVPALPLLVAAPAHAATNVLCVNRPADEADCASRPDTIPLAITAAATDGADSVIRIGPRVGNYTDGPYVFDGTINGSLTVQGSNNGTGANATILQGGTAAPYVTVSGATLRNVRITLSGEGGEGLRLDGASALAANVVVADTAQTVATNAVGIRVQGGKAQNSTVNLVRAAGNTGIHQATGNAVLSRVTTRASGTGVVVAGGSLAIDNSVLDLNTTGVAGLRAGTDASTGNISVDARHLTVVGGAAGSRGVWSFADDAVVSSTVTLANSIVRGPTHTLAAAATLGSAEVGVSYTDYQTEQETGTGVVTPGAGNLDVDPAFVDPPADDLRVRAGSPVVDKGSSLVTSGDDRDDGERSFDGDGNGSPIPDMGAYELRDVTAPNTTFTSGPSGPSSDRTPVFVFRSEEGATFECQIDAGAWQKCASPVTTTPLPEGAHRFSVRATDEVFNTEAAPATRNFTVDTVRPNATVTKRPPKRFFKSRVKAKFASNEAGVGFQCRLDNRGWQKCSSPYRFTVGRGKHTLLVRAIDAAGNTDSTPARVKFKRLTRRR